MASNQNIIIGILPEITLDTDDRPYNDKYSFCDVYSKRIIECGAIPLGILLQHGKLDYKTLEVCDAFLIPGGKQVFYCYYEVIQYAIKHNKPLLGICLGLEAMAIYSMIYDEKYTTLEELINRYQELKKENEGTLLQKIDSPITHYTRINYENADIARHEVNIIDKDSIIYKIFKKDTLNVVSMHSHNPKWIGGNFKVTATTSDGVVEVLEYDKPDYFIVGVHFHPEWDDDNLIVRRLVKEASNRK